MVNVKTFVATLKVLAQEIVAVVAFVSVVFFLPVKKINQKSIKALN